MLGEDSGLEVEGLGGAPGIRSARYAPEGGEAVAKLLGELRGIGGDGRRAHYVCELVLVAPDGRELRGTGTLEGRIADEPRGSEGFGYDPVFVPTARSEPSPSSETTGSRATPTGPARPRLSATCYARPEGSASSRLLCEESHQLISAPKTITFAIT